MAVGFALLIAFAMALAGHLPSVMATLVFASQTIRCGYEGLLHYFQRLNQAAVPRGCAPWLSIVFPLAAFLLFSMIFILAIG